MVRQGLARTAAAHRIDMAHGIACIVQKHNDVIRRCRPGW
jgi:hypothetical protein